ncbi:MAG: UDP-N-acetylmuramoyl-L-alanyl-D-glutamate--2,6-diaminopimelate ligase [Ilumatobacteraceae bacterium]
MSADTVHPRLPLSAVVAGARSVRVRELVGSRAGVERLAVDSDPLVRDITFDSRQVAPGTLFCCLRGERRDGHEFAADAVASGAVAVLVDHVMALEGVVQVVVDDTRVAMAELAASLFGHPSARLDVIGITGTNGKTTTAHILASALEALGSPTGVIGTLSGTHTTPEAPDLQRRLAGFLADGKRTVAMEVSSHALALDRVVGTHFRIGVFTNLGHDHLDLHGTQERYFAAKARLFEPDLTTHGVVNIDDVHGQLLADAHPIPMTTFSANDISDVIVGAFDHEYTWRGQRIRVGLGGRFNVMNSLAAATTLAVLGHEPAAISSALAMTTSVPGRFERIDAGQSFAVIVDYAHTPDALEQVLAAGRVVAGSNRVVVVFGCGGDRDHDKRPEMGRAAAQGADSVVITSDNPRSEDPAAIINDAIRGVPENYRGRIAVEPDRFQAIALALRTAGPGDVVIIAGKGHETTQTFHGTVASFDDRVVARELLENVS